MANTKRRSEYIDRNGNMFVPMNVEGGTWREGFMSTPKLITILMIAASCFIIVTYLNSNRARFLGYVILLGIWFLLSVTALRFIVFEEKFYYKMYKELQKHKISSPALFWDIASIKDTDEGAILTYSDARIAVMVKLERDTITGKNTDFKETHYDAISDFYKELMVNNFSFVQMNIMEQAGKDPRLIELDKLVTKSNNSNICKLMELQIGYIKNITHKSLYESDYFLIYTYDLSKVETIIGDVIDCLFKILDGAFISYRFLSQKDIVDMVKEQYAVNYFNSTEASIMMFNNTGNGTVQPFILSGLLWNDENEQELNQKEKYKLRNITSGILRGTYKQQDISLKDTIYRENTKNKIGVDFSKLSEMPTDNSKNRNNTKKSNTTINRSTKIKQNSSDNKVSLTKKEPIQNKVDLNKTDDFIDLGDSNDMFSSEPIGFDENTAKLNNNNNVFDTSNNDEEFIDL